MSDVDLLLLRFAWEDLRSSNAVPHTHCMGMSSFEPGLTLAKKEHHRLNLTM